MDENQVIAAENAEIQVDTGNAAENAEQEAVINYDELVKTDKELQSFLDKRATAAQRKQEAAIREAVEKERRRQQQLAAANLSRAEKEKIMKPEELAEMYRKEADELRSQMARQDEIRTLTAEIGGILEESKIPAELFNAGLDYFKEDAENIRERALLFSRYEFYPKGEFDKRVDETAKAKFDNATKQKAPEVHNKAADKSIPSRELKPFYLP